MTPKKKHGNYFQMGGRSLGGGVGGVGGVVIRELKQRRRRRLGKRRLKTELEFLLQISRMAGCIQSA